MGLSSRVRSSLPVRLLFLSRDTPVALKNSPSLSHLAPPSHRSFVPVLGHTEACGGPVTALHELGLQQAGRDVNKIAECVLCFVLHNWRQPHKSAEAVAGRLHRTLAQAVQLRNPPGRQHEGGQWSAKQHPGLMRSIAVRGLGLCTIPRLTKNAIAKRSISHFAALRAFVNTPFVI